MKLFGRNCPPVLGELLIWQLKSVFVAEEGSLRVTVGLFVKGRRRQVRLDYKGRVVMVGRSFFYGDLPLYLSLLRLQEFIGFATVRW